MKDFIELISSISVLIASFAGLSAINKWKTEKFEKEKINSIEEYEKDSKDVIDKISIIRKKEVFKDLEELDYENIVPDVALVKKYFDVKEKDFEDLQVLIRKMEVSLSSYSGYTGESMDFHFNYYFYNYIMMRKGMLSFAEESITRTADKESFAQVVYNHFLLESNKDKEIDIIDVLMSYTPMDFLYLDGIRYYNIQDCRHKYNKLFGRRVQLEKIYVHSGVFNKLYISAKILFIKFYVWRKVLLMSDKAAYVIMWDGKLKRVAFSGKTKRTLEKELRRKAVLSFFKKFDVF